MGMLNGTEHTRSTTTATAAKKRRENRAQQCFISNIELNIEYATLNLTVSHLTSNVPSIYFYCKFKLKYLCCCHCCHKALSATSANTHRHPLFSHLFISVLHRCWSACQSIPRYILFVGTGTHARTHMYAATRFDLFTFWNHKRTAYAYGVRRTLQCNK